MRDIELKPPSQIFISHFSEKDAIKWHKDRVVLPLRHLVKDLGYTPCLENDRTHTATDGKPLTLEVEFAIKHSRVFLLCLTENYLLKSPSCVAELAAALRFQVPIVTILLDYFPPASALAEEHAQPSWAEELKINHARVRQWNRETQDLLGHALATLCIPAGDHLTQYSGHWKWDRTFSGSLQRALALGVAASVRAVAAGEAAGLVREAALNFVAYPEVPREELAEQEKQAAAAAAAKEEERRKAEAEKERLRIAEEERRIRMQREQEAAKAKELEEKKRREEEHQALVSARGAALRVDSSRVDPEQERILREKEAAEKELAETREKLAQAMRQLEEERLMNLAEAARRAEEEKKAAAEAEKLEQERARAEAAEQKLAPIESKLADLERTIASKEAKEQSAPPPPPPPAATSSKACLIL